MRERQARLARAARAVVSRARGEQDVNRLIVQGLELGAGAFVARTVRIDPGFPWLVRIGEGATLGPGVEIIVHDASTKRSLGYSRLGLVSIGAGAYIGARAVILPGATVGDGAVVGAGSVVRGNVPANSVVYGNPAELKGSVTDFLERHRLRMASATLLPAAGWTASTGPTPERMREMRALLANGPVYIE